MPRYGMSNGCRCTRTFLGAPPTPRFGVSEAKLQTPGAKNAPRERVGLFDIVRWELPKTVRQRTASSGCPEPPHPEERACGSAAANQVARARVSKDGAAVTPSCFETHRSGRRPRKAPALASRCDAPQHEGEGRRAFWRNEPNRHFGRTKPSGELGVFGPSEAPTFGCRKRPRAQFHCFRPVLYNDFCNSHVSAALSAQDFPKATFAQTWPWSRRHIRPGPTRSSIARGASPPHRAAVCWCVPTDACDESCATAATPTQIISTGCAQQLCIPGGRLASIVAADAKSYDSGVT